MGIIDVTESKSSPPPNNVLRLLYPQFESFLGIDLQTTSREKADIVELAAVWFHQSDMLTNIESFDFRPEGTRGGSSDGQWPPQFSECRDRVAAILADPPIVVVHDIHIVRTLRIRLPDWNPGLVMSTTRFARAVMPELESYALGDLIVRLDLDDKYDLHKHGPVLWSQRRCIAVACLFLKLLHAAKSRGLTQHDIRFAGALRLASA